MSVLIKGMEMPTSCDDCAFCQRDISGYDWCCIPMVSGRSKPLDEPVLKPDWCPLVPVPPHGDLIDKDALMKILSKVIDINASIEQRNEATDQERRCLWWFEQQIGIAPTIIPAEEGE